MAQLARFWTYRAGTPVYAMSGQLVGEVAAVRPDAVLVSSRVGRNQWIADLDVVDYDGEGLTIAKAPEEIAKRPAHRATARTEDILLSERTLPVSRPQRRGPAA